MANDRQQVATQERPAQPPQQRLTIAESTARLIHFMDGKQEQITLLLGGKESYERFKGVVAMALHRTPDMLDCDPKSFIDSCLMCAADGLMPDGKRGALVAFKDRQSGKKICQWMPMLRGIIECMHRTGYVRDVQAEVVYRGEHFVNVGGLEPKLEHVFDPDKRVNDKDIIYAYAVVRTVNGGIYPKVLTRAEIDKVRGISKTDKVWGPFFSEMAKKTVIRNLSKSLPFDLDVFSRDDGLYDLDRRPALPPVKTAALTHDPADDIPEDEPASGAEQSQPQGKENDPPAKPSPARKDAAKPVSDAQAAPQPQPEPEPAQDASDGAKEPQDAQPEPPPILTEQGVIGMAARRAVKATTWDEIEKLMAYLRDERTGPWEAACAIGDDKRLYQFIRTLPVWEDGFPGDALYQEMSGA